MYGTGDSDKEWRLATIHHAKLDQMDNRNSASWIPTGEHVKRNNTAVGYRSDAFELSSMPMLADIQVDGGANNAGIVTLQLSQPDREAIVSLSSNVDDYFIFCLRNWKLTDISEKRMYCNNRSMSIWGKCIRSMMNETMIGIEVHTAAEMLNDGKKVTMGSMDAMTNDIRSDHNLGQRLATMIPQPQRTGPAPDNWMSATTDW